jgi:hypothetical protein
MKMIGTVDAFIETKDLDLIDRYKGFEMDNNHLKVNNLFIQRTQGSMLNWSNQIDFESLK